MKLVQLRKLGQAGADESGADRGDVDRRGSGQRRVALVEDDRLRLLDAQTSPTVYHLAQHALREHCKLTEAAEAALTSEHLDYGDIYRGSSEWRLLPSFDHPEDEARCMVSGTGLTHKASAENRAAMHKSETAEITDSILMYRLGLTGGKPAQGEIGVQPEWFFKGDGAILKAHGEPLEIPPFACDGGEEPEVAGAYLISPDGTPLRVGFTVANEFSDHVMEKKNYLYLAPSKLRSCSIGPELTIGDFDFDQVPGTVSISRDGAILWRKEIWSGQANMSHSLPNLEHHHFKYPAHRRPGDVHIHFFGADAFSFGEGVTLVDGDLMEVSFPLLGRPLLNTLRVHHQPQALVSVVPM